jgi:hypothetical protein
LKNCSSEQGLSFTECEGTLIGCNAQNGFLLRDGAIAIDCHAEGSAFNFEDQGLTTGTFDFTITNCSAGDNSFGYIATGSAGTLELIGTFTNCKAGDNSFGCTTGADYAILFEAKAYNCIAENQSFGTSIAIAIAGSHTETIGTNAILQDCRGGDGSFAGEATGAKRGTFIRCYCINSDADAGPLVGPTGYMQDCTWIALGSGKSAIRIQNNDARIYGGIYMAGNMASQSIVPQPISTAYDAKIIGIKMNAPIDTAWITNLALTNSTDTAGNIEYTAL